MRLILLFANRCHRLNGLAILCVFFAAFFEDKFASATCGSYLRGPESSLNLDAHGISTTSREPANPANQPFCAGPRCRRHDSSPVTPGSSPPFQMNRDAVIARVLHSKEINDGTAGCEAENDIFRSTAASDQIFRPPRKAQSSRST